MCDRREIWSPGAAESAAPSDVAVPIADPDPDLSARKANIQVCNSARPGGPAVECGCHDASHLSKGRKHKNSPAVQSNLGLPLLAESHLLRPQKRKPTLDELAPRRTVPNDDIYSEPTPPLLCKGRLEGQRKSPFQR